MTIKNIILLCNNICPLSESRVFKQAASLKANGFGVQCIAYKGGGLQSHEIYQQIPIHRLELFTKLNISDSKFYQKLLNILPAIKVFKVLIYLEYTLKILLKYFHNADAVHCFRLKTLPIGVLIKVLSLGRKKLVYDAREFETEVHNLIGFKKKCLKLVERALIGVADQVICVSNSIANEYVKLYQLPKPKVILNCPQAYNCATSNDILRETFNIPANTMIFLYVGNFGNGRGIDMLLDVFKKRDTQDKVLIFLGYGPLLAKIKEASRSCNNIFYHPEVPQAELLKYVASADVGMLMFENTCLNHYYCLPNKLFEYIQAGITVMASNLYELSMVVTKHHIGLVMAYDTSTLAAAVEQLTYADIAKFKPQILSAQKLYTWYQQEKVLLKLYRELD